METEKSPPFPLGEPLYIKHNGGGMPARIIFVSGYSGASILLKGLGPIEGQALVVEVVDLTWLQQTHTIRHAIADDDDALVAEMLAAIQVRQVSLARESGLLTGLAERLRTL